MDFTTYREKVSKQMKFPFFPSRKNGPQIGRHFPVWDIREMHAPPLSLRSLSLAQVLLVILGQLSKGKLSNDY